MSSEHAEERNIVFHNQRVSTHPLTNEEKGIYEHNN